MQRDEGTCVHCGLHVVRFEDGELIADLTLLATCGDYFEPNPRDHQLDDEDEALQCCRGEWNGAGVQCDGMCTCADCDDQRSEYGGEPAPTGEYDDTLTLAEIRNGTGFPAGARFRMVTP